MIHNKDYCPKYNDKVLPDEKGNCSLCGATLTDGETMKYFLATYEILDGEHEHKGNVIIEANTLKDATKIAEANEHDTEHYTSWIEKEGAYFDFRDGLTAARNRGVTEITEGEMKTLERLGVAYRL